MALTEQADVQERASAFGMLHEYGVSAGVEIFKGAQLVLSGGFIEPGTTATGLVIVGRSEENVDNTAGADGDLRCKVTSGIFRYANSVGDPIAATDVGSECFVEDDEFISLTDGVGTQSSAGRIYDFDTTVTPSAIWVAQQYPMGV